MCVLRDTIKYILQLCLAPNSQVKKKPIKKMNRQYYLLISIVLAAVVITSLVSFVYLSNKSVVATPAFLYVAYYALLGQNSSSGALNASQGATQQVNYTLASMCPAQMAINIENLTLTSYDSFYNSWNSSGSAWNPAVRQETVFNYTFSLSQLTLQPNTSNSTIITMKWANNAPTGRYILTVNLGKVEFLTEPSKYDGESGYPVALEVIVNSKAT